MTRAESGSIRPLWPLGCRSIWTAPRPIRFAIVHYKSRKIVTYTTFNDFVTGLTTELNGTDAVLQFDAFGPYDAATGVLSAEEVFIGTNDRARCRSVRRV